MTEEGGAASGSVAGLAELRTVADYQFAGGAGRTLFPPDEALELRRSSSGRPRQVIAEEGRLVSYGVDGLFTLGIAGGRRLVEAFEAPRLRVVIGDESEPFVREGRNVFAKFVREADPGVRPGDEVVITHHRGEVVGVGEAELSAAAMADFETGMAVSVRHGAGD